MRDEHETGSAAAADDAHSGETGGGHRDIQSLRTVADYQFGAGAGQGLFPPTESFEIRRSTGGRPRQIYANESRLVSYGTDGRFTLGIGGGKRLADTLTPPTGRVVVGDDSEPFVRDGKNVFAKFVIDCDSLIRPGDEILVVHERGDLLAVGRADLSADAMADFETGMAVKVREGIDE